LEKTLKHCKKCDQEITGTYCANCGQRASVYKVTFKETFNDLADSMFSLSAPLWTTLRLLFTNPGKLLREYLNGRRKRYYKPVTFFILTTIVYLLCKSLLDYNPLSSSPQQNSELIDASVMYEAGQYMFAHIDKILFFFVFALALSLKLFFFRKNSLAEFVAISFYLLGVYTLLSTAKIFIYTYVTHKYEMLPIVLMLFYFSWALVSFFQKKKLLVFIKGILTYLLGFVLYALFGIGFSLIIILMRS
jgi:hypothetical protein